MGITLAAFAGAIGLDARVENDNVTGRLSSAFYGYSENAVKTQIWIAVSVYVLVAIVRKRLVPEASLHEILQVLSVTLFEQVPILQAFGDVESQEKVESVGLIAGR